MPLPPFLTPIRLCLQLVRNFLVLPSKSGHLVHVPLPTTTESWCHLHTEQLQWPNPLPPTLCVPLKKVHLVTLSPTPNSGHPPHLSNTCMRATSCADQAVGFLLKLASSAHNPVLLPCVGHTRNVCRTLLRTLLSEVQADVYRLLCWARP